MPRSLGVAIVTLSCILPISAIAQQQSSSFTLGTATADRGQKATGFIEVPAGVDAGTHSCGNRARC